MEQIGEGRERVHADEGRLFWIDAAFLQHHVLAIFSRVGIGLGCPAAAMVTFQGCFGNALHQPVMAVAIGNKIADGADLQAMQAREGNEIGQAGHGAIIVHDLTDHARRVEPGEARDVHGGLGVASANQHAAITRDKREDVARVDDMLWPLGTIDSDRDGAGAISGGYAGGDALLGLDRDREGGAMASAVVLRHQGQAKLPDALGGQRQADQATTKARHEVDGVRRRHLGGDDEVALILPVLVVDKDEHPAVAGLLDDRLDGGERRAGIAAGEIGIQLAQGLAGGVPVRIVKGSKRIGVEPCGAG